MNVVVFGATGVIGTRITAELEQRGHAETAATRATGADVTDPQSVASVAAGADAVVSAVSARGRELHTRRRRTGAGRGACVKQVCADSSSSAEPAAWRSRPASGYKTLPGCCAGPVDGPAYEASQRTLVYCAQDVRNR
jgi:uncharacterized protein YbjT (DUF2867 family)